MVNGDFRIKPVELFIFVFILFELSFPLPIFDCILIKVEDCILIIFYKFPTMYFASNLKFLRKRKKKTQDFVSSSLNMNRSTLNNYENEITAPSISALLAFSDYYRISIDSLLRVDLSQLLESQLYELEHGADVYLRGKNIRVLATTVDSRNRENVELVPKKAKAGYLSGYADPEYISELPVFQLPFLSPEKKYRTFQLDGDSMLPIPDGAWVTGEFVQDWNSIKSDELYVVLTLNDGLVFKKIRNELKEAQQLQLISLNPAYSPYYLPASELLEVWKFVHYITNVLPETSDIDKIGNGLAELKREIRVIRERMGNRKGV
jgi:transcriptional regulator with XRE-family HTH domain